MEKTLEKNGLLKNKNAVLFLSSQTLSVFGSSLVQHSMNWYVTLKTQSGVMMAIVILSAMIPQFFMSPLAGVWADRYNRKHLIIFADLAIAVTTFALAISFFLGYEMLWLLFLTSALRSTFQSVQSPAISAFLPQLVKDDELMRFNAVNSSLQSLILIVSPMLGGLLLSLVSIENIFFIDVATAILASTIFSVFVKVAPHNRAQTPQTTSQFQDFKDGLSYISKHIFLKKFFIINSCFFFLVSPTAFLTPLQVSRNFGSDVWRLTAVETSFAVGMLVGGLVIAATGGLKNKLYNMAAAMFLLGILTVSFGYIDHFWTYITVMGVSGLSLPTFGTSFNVLIQQNVEEGFLGRVFSVSAMASGIMMPLGMVVFGPLGDIVSIEIILIATGILIFIIGFFVMTIKTGKSEKSEGGML